MACRNNLTPASAPLTASPASQQTASQEPLPETPILRLGVNTAVPADRELQNDMTLLDWVALNKLYPDFWGRFFGGKDSITAEEIDFLHNAGCKIALIYNGYRKPFTQTGQQGIMDAKKAFIAAAELNIPKGTALFLDVCDSQDMPAEYLKGFAESLLGDGYIPGFYAPTGHTAGFNHQFSRGCQRDPDIFGQALVWAASPTLEKYNQTADTHWIHPDEWRPYAPSGTTQEQIAVWQYGRDCHPIQDYNGRPTAFHLDLVRDSAIILEKMF